MINREKVRNSHLKMASQAAENLKKYRQRDDSLKKTEQLERIRSNSLREAKRSEVEKIVAATERVVRGKDQSQVKAPSIRVENIGAPVARLHEDLAMTEPKGFGTGFLIAPNILITNYHVFEVDIDAMGCVANFKYQFNLQSSSTTPGAVFKLRPDIFFFSNEYLDYALVYVEENSVNSQDKLSSFGCLPAIATKGKVKLGDHMNIIQYPQGAIKKYTTEDNEIFDINDEDGIIYYYTDTEPGSSGSPGFNDFWEVAALHYTGVPNVNENGEWLTKDKKVWNNTMPESEIDWIANAGKSISKIVSHLGSLTLPEEKQKYVNTILSNSRDPLADVPAPVTEAVKTVSSTPINEKAMSKYSFVFNGTTNFTINEATVPAAVPQVVAANGVDKVVNKLIEIAVEKKERFDEDYTTRRGYDELFIPGFKVPMPTVIDSREKELYKNFGASVPFIVPYHHYSLVMNKKRRMAMWTASNVDYNEKYRDERDRDDFGNGAWRLDKRIPAKYQIQADEFYDPATLVDKGHLVRRDDNCWAELKNNASDSIGIEYANADTYHWTNCTPQHEAFNRDTAQYTGVGKWGILENAIKKQLDDPANLEKDYGQRACVLSGPVLDENDPEYMDIQYPLRFWKVFAINSESAGKLVYGFVLSQEDKVDETGLEKEGMPRFNRKVKAMQASLKFIESISGVVFDNSLHEHDVKKGEDTDPHEALESNLSNLRTPNNLKDPRYN